MASFYIPEKFNNIQLKNRCIPQFVIFKFNVDPQFALSNRLPNLLGLSSQTLTLLVSSNDNLLIKDKLIDLIERTFQREGSPYLACGDRNAFFTSEKPKKYHPWSCQNVCDALTFCWTTFLFDLAPSSIDK